MSWLDGWWAASYVVLWLLVVTLAVVVVALARQIGTLHLRLGPRGALEIDDEGPPLGEVPAEVEVTALDGRDVVLGGPGEPQLLLFVSPGCHVCRQVLPSLRAVAAASDFAPYVVSDGDASETAEAYLQLDLRAPVVASGDAPRRFSVPGTPYVVVLDRGGAVVAKGTVNNLEQVEGLVETAARRVGARTAESSAP